jgi:membrane-bound lytic murein transglycosylase B
MGLVSAATSWLRRSALPAAALGVVLMAVSGGAAAASGGFESWVRGFWPEAQARGISAETFNRAFTGVTPDPEVIELASRQPEFVRPVSDYIASAVSESRIETGREMLVRYERLLDAVEARYGVSRHIVVAIWGMESSYGAVLENTNIVRPVIRSLATLAYEGGRRAGFGRQQLLAALEILERGDITPDRMYGSWAGAMGHTQFIPTTYNEYAVDFDGSGRRDIWNSIPDALGSTAAYLSARGWRPGETWGYEVVLPDGFDFALADERKRRPLSEWERLGVRRVLGQGYPRPGDEAYMMLPAGANGPAFLVLRNFRAILAYNNANSYALAVGHLADRLKGVGPFVGSWPENDRPLTAEQRRELQEHLVRRGYDTGGIDGQVGPMTRSAIRSYQSRNGLPADGYAGYSLLERLRTGSAGG